MKLIKGSTLEAILEQSPTHHPSAARPKAGLRSSKPFARPSATRYSSRSEARQCHGRCFRRGPGHGLGTGQSAPKG
jgi:hypothetical protein